MLARIRNEEQGVALVTAAVVSLVIFSLCTVVLQLSIHNTERSAADRRRVQAIDAAEAGIDYYFNYLARTGENAVCSPQTRSMPRSTATFTVQAFFYDSNQTPVSPACSVANAAYVRVYSEGKASPTTASRKMEAYAKLTPSRGATFDNENVIFAQNNVSFTSNARLGGSLSNDADIYSNGNFTLASNSTIFGRVFAQGSVTLGSNSSVKRDVWANLAITLNARSSIGDSRGGNATSSTSSITLGNNGRIYGNARAGTTITGGTVDGTRTQYAPQAAPSPVRPFPAFTYCDASNCISKPQDWLNAGYTIAPTFSGATACADAVNHIRNTWTSGNLLVRIAAPGSTCTTTFPVGSTTNVRGDLAIISDGPITLATNARFVQSGTSSNRPCSPGHCVFVYAGLSGVAPCNFTANANSGFGPGLLTLIYAPSTCTVDLLSNSGISQGQIIAGTINFKHTATFSFQRVTPPGGGVGGFKQDVLYKREVSSLG